MNTKNISSLILFVVCIMFCACSDLNPSEKLLVGSWYDTGNMKSEGQEIVYEGTSTYNEDRTCMSKYSMRITYYSEGIQEIVTVSYKTKGKWKIEGKLLVESCTDADVKVDNVDLMGEELTTDIEKIKEVKNSEIERFRYDAAIPLKSNLLKGSKDRIVKLNESFLVTIDNGNQRSEYRRVSYTK